MLVEPVLNNIKTYATGTHEREEQSQQNLEVVSCSPLQQEHHRGRHYEYQVDESSNYERPQWRTLI